MDQIDRLRAMAREAVMEYQLETRAGGEPSYPHWADDIFVVCEQAEAGLRFAAASNTDARAAHRDPGKLRRHSDGPGAAHPENIIPFPLAGQRT